MAAETLGKPSALQQSVRIMEINDKISAMYSASNEAGLNMQKSTDPLIQQYRTDTFKDVTAHYSRLSDAQQKAKYALQSGNLVQAEKALYRANQSFAVLESLYAGNPNAAQEARLANGPAQISTTPVDQLDEAAKAERLAAAKEAQAARAAGNGPRPLGQLLTAEKAIESRIVTQQAAMRLLPIVGTGITAVAGAFSVRDRLNHDDPEGAVKAVGGTAGLVAGASVGMNLPAPLYVKLPASAILGTVGFLGGDKVGDMLVDNPEPSTDFTIRYGYNPDTNMFSEILAGSGFGKLQGNSYPLKQVIDPETGALIAYRQDGNIVRLGTDPESGKPAVLEPNGNLFVIANSHYAPSTEAAPAAPAPAEAAKPEAEAKPEATPAAPAPAEAAKPEAEAKPEAAPAAPAPAEAAKPEAEAKPEAAPAAPAPAEAAKPEAEAKPEAAPAVPAKTNGGILAAYSDSAKIIAGSFPGLGPLALQGIHMLSPNGKTTVTPVDAPAEATKPEAEASAPATQSTAPATTETEQMGPPAEAPKAEVEATAQTEATTKTYTITKGDSLSSIITKQYPGVPNNGFGYLMLREAIKLANPELKAAITSDEQFKLSLAVGSQINLPSKEDVLGSLKTANITYEKAEQEICEALKCPNAGLKQAAQKQAISFAQ